MGLGMDVRVLVCGVSLFAAACGLDDAGRPTAGETSRAALAPVTWTNVVGVSAAGNDLAKTGANGWNGGAVSTTTIAADGAVEFTTGENTLGKAVGLSSGDSSQSYTDIDFCFYLASSGALRVYEGGVQVASVGTYAASDVFRIEVTGGVVRYRQNGALKYTSAAIPAFPLLVDTALNQTGATVADVMFGDTIWQNATGVAVSGFDLTKTGANGWNAGASSIGVIGSDGAVEFTTLENTKGKIAGLSRDDVDQSYQDVDFGWLLAATGTARVYEGGVAKTTAEAYAPGDVFRVEVVASQVHYRHNGVLVYTSSVAPVFPLLVDASLNQTGATLRSVVLRHTFWQNPVGVAITNYTLTKTGAAGWNAGASTIPSIGASGGYTEFSTLETTAAKTAGLSFGDGNQKYGDIDFAFFLTATAKVKIYEGGVTKATLPGNYAAGDVFRVEVVGGAVTYRWNGALVYTSSVAPVYPLLFDSSLNQTGATIANVAIQPNPPHVPADCGDGAGAGGEDIVCWCGDTVVTDTALAPADPVAFLDCEAVGLSIAPGVALTMTGVDISGSGYGTGIVVSDGGTITGGVVTGFDIGVDVVGTAVTITGPANLDDNGSAGLEIFAGADVTASAITIARNGGSGVLVFGGLDARALDIDSNAAHGVLVDSADPVTLSGCQVHDSGRHPLGTVANQDGIFVLRAAAGFVTQLDPGIALNEIHGNTGWGVELGHPTAQTGVVNGQIGDSQIFANDLGGIRVQELDLTTRTSSAILANNIYDNGGPGISVSTSFQTYVPYLDDGTIVSNDVHHNAVSGEGCTPQTGASESASQVVFDRPIATSDPNGLGPAGPSPAYPDDFRCYWGADTSDRNDTEATCAQMNDPSLESSPEAGYMVNHCLWNGFQCRIAWDIAGLTESGTCNSSRNRIYAYVNSPVQPQITQRGVVALHGAYVRAESNRWGVGGPYEGYAVDAGFGSLVSVNDSCGTESTCP